MWPGDVAGLAVTCVPRDHLGTSATNESIARSSEQQDRTSQPRQIADLVHCKYGPEASSHGICAGSCDCSANPVSALF